MKNLKIVAIDNVVVPDFLGEFVLRLIAKAQLRLVSFTLYVEPETPYRSIHRVSSSRIRLFKQRRPPIVGATLAVYLAVYDMDCCYNCYLSPPEGTDIVSTIRRLALAQFALEDELDGIAMKQTPVPEDFAVKPELLVSPSDSHSDLLNLLGEWEKQMIKNLHVIAKMRDEIIDIVAKENIELRRNASKQVVSPGMHQANKKQWRMYRILRAILLIARKSGDFDPGLALESIHKQIPKEANMEMIRFRKLVTMDKYYRAHRSGPFSLYYITPKGRQLLTELTPKDPLFKRHLI